MKARAAVLFLVVVAVTAGLILLLRARREPLPAVDLGPAELVGRKACAGCHAKEDALWRGSHHALAMQPADPSTVIGDFDHARFTYNGITSTFSRQGDKFLVKTDGPDGRLAEFEVAYTFGVYPLQQYLIAMPGGRYQALSICWDARPAKEGGQRWFHLYPSERIDHRDPLHWTGPYQNWNFMCAECHSTGVEKSYRPETDSYETTFFEIDVSCEACHGPGSRHVRWAQAERQGRASADPGKGLRVRLPDDQPVTWEFDMATGIAKRSAPRKSHGEVEVCGRCHARRGTITEEYESGRPLADTHRPSLLEAGLYFADGQQQDEVYEYGSFLQSRMSQAGVTCTDCHEPHGVKRPATADGVCARCHLPEKFATPAHHFHQASSRGASCVECHMPARNYMVVDARRDHGFRVPRPDLSIEIGAPNACTGCHRDRTPHWAANAAKRFWGTQGRYGQPHFGEVLQAGREEAPGSGRALASLAADTERPAIVRATALSLLSRVGGAAADVLAQALRDPDPIVRYGAVSAASGADPRSRFALLAPLLSDPVRLVRIDAARALVGPAVDLMTPDRRRAFDGALGEWIAAQHANADRAESHVNLGALHAERQEWDAAEREYRTALALLPAFVPTYVNLADLYKLRGRDNEGERILRRGLEAVPGNASLLHALGLCLAREKKMPEAIEALRRAAESEPAEARFAYVYAVALQDTGQPDRALAVLRAAHERHPGNRDVLLALVALCREQGHADEAARYARAFIERAPDDPVARQLMGLLSAGR